MNDHTRRLLDRMRSLLSQYHQQKISLRFLVDGLEANYITLEEPLPEGFYRGWYSHWGELEVILALGAAGLSNESEKSAQIAAAVKALESLIQTVESSHP